ncbi:hypothetical protein [Levilactobacillus yiduensis]|uniref:hypothetical protein n=1 Tax=Levilactobacillus yiduensis TaxID=2953880 RepID=UPI000EF2F74C|nr:hypothetical protein [Levilactobacillus yiduensis]AYM03310.1 hypothetical protein D8911_09980 [Levilactobacillus brevis]
MKSTVQTQRWYGYFFIGLSVVALGLTGLLAMPLIDRALLLTTALTLLVYGLTYQPQIKRGWWRLLLVASLIVGIGDVALTLTVAPVLLTALFSFALPFAFLSVLLGYLKRRVRA